MNELLGDGINWRGVVDSAANYVQAMRELHRISGEGLDYTDLEDAFEMGARYANRQWKEAAKNPNSGD